MAIHTDNQDTKRAKRPVKVLQFGEGNFLRAFADWMIDVANEKGATDLGIAIVKPRSGKSTVIDTLNRQGCVYHVVLEGVEGGQPKRSIRRITSVETALTPDDHRQYEELILSDDLRFVISNSTEAGIRYAQDDVTATVPSTFPGKVTNMLWRRFRHFNGDRTKGLLFLPCELIEDNGARLKEYVLRHASEANLGSEFTEWVEHSCAFADTLVDRIVSGAPENPEKEKAEIGSDDNAIVKGELYSLWVIGGDRADEFADELPLHKAGLNVRFTNSVKDYRDKKVRILNGSHTGMVAMSLLAGYETVMDAFADKEISAFISRMVRDEVLPVIEGDRKELEEFADGILERFLNPFVRHQLKSIALNSLSKWEVRNYITAQDYWDKFGRTADYELFTLASLLALYAPGSGFTPDDTPAAVEFIHREWDDSDMFSTVDKILGSGHVFTIDLGSAVPGLTEKVAEYAGCIRSKGIRAALTDFLRKHE